MGQELDLYVGMCSRDLAEPYVTSTAVACELKGCGHLVWCADSAKLMWCVLRVLCKHCAEGIIPKEAGG